MRKLLQIILILISNLSLGQQSGQDNQEGAVKFIFVGDNTKPIVLDKYTVNYNKLKITLQPDTNNFDSSIIKTNSGIYTFHIQSEKFKDVIITNVEITEGKTNFVTIKLTSKKTALDKSVIKLKYQKPKGEKNCETKT